MPIYEYLCQGCGERVEVLVRGSEAPACPACGSDSLERVLSLPRIQSTGTRERALAAAKKRDAKRGVERVRAQEEYTRNHDD